MKEKKARLSRAKRKKIIWAIDPYGGTSFQSSAASLARLLSLHNDVEVVYVRGRSGFPAETEPAAIRFGLSSAETQLRKILGELKFKPRRPPQILAHGSPYVRSDVRTLVRYAKKVKADAVLVSTNARSGLVRQALGSFSETLVLESAIPIMIVHPKAKADSKPGTILFPTDFSDHSWKAFQQVVSFAKTTGAKVTIFHQYQGEFQSVPEGVSYFTGGRWLKGDRLLDDDLQKVKSKLSKWIDWTEKQNVPCHHVIQFGSENIADATLELAKKERPWMIAMATVTGPIAATFLGSNARWIVRSADYPVWVLYVHDK
jgi:nucleotide-binding universal stress UspA family protein